MRQLVYSSRGALAALPLFSCILRVCSASAVCYYPNGGIASTYSPCNTTSDGSPSACCELSSSACSQTGYCYGNAGVMYRGGCTDSSFAAVQCPQRCKDVNTNAFSNINLCPDSDHNGLFTCSGSGQFTTGLCQTNFTFNAGTPFTPSSSSSASQGTTTVTTTATSSASSTSSSSPLSSETAQPSCPNPALTVGLAVGVPLGLIAALLAAVVVWQRRKYNSIIRPNTASMPNHGYPPSAYTAATSGTYGTEPPMSQPYPGYYPQQQQQPEWKPPQAVSPAELQTVQPRHELQEG